MFTQSEVERTTAATDALLGALCLVLAIQLMATPTLAPWKRNVWIGVLALMSCGSILGAVAHGLQLTAASRTAVWKPLYLTLGLAVALVVVVATYDGWGEVAARRLLPWALGVGLLFFAVTQRDGSGFLLFVVYEAVATVGALAVYTRLSVAGSLPGASAIAVGLGVSLVAAAIQRTSLTAHVLVRFDHNGLFHLVQLVGVVAIALGARAGLALPLAAP